MDEGAKGAFPRVELGHQGDLGNFGQYGHNVHRTILHRHLSYMILPNDATFTFFIFAVRYPLVNSVFLTLFLNFAILATLDYLSPILKIPPILIHTPVFHDLSY